MEEFKQERKHKRSHEEVIAAREAYLKAKAERDQARAEKKVQRERFIREKQERKVARERRKNMTEGERAQALHEAKLEKLNKRRGKNAENSWWYELPVFKGEVVLGKTYTVKFAGGFERGVLEKIERSGLDNDLYVRPGTEGSIFYIIKSVENGRTWRYPVHREDIIAEGFWYRDQESK